MGGAFRYIFFLMKFLGFQLNSRRAQVKHWRTRSVFCVRQDHGEGPAQSQLRGRSGPHAAQGESRQRVRGRAPVQPAARGPPGPL